MPDVTKQITLSGGAPPRQIQCWLKLVAGVDQEAFGYTSTTSLGGADLYEPDNTGLVTFAGLTPNVSITPAGTVYKCTTVFPDGSRIVEFIEVPNQAGPLDFDDLLTTEPSDLPPAGAVNAELGGVLTGTVGAAAYVADSVTTAAIAPEAVTATELAGEIVGVVYPLDDLTGWTDAHSVLPDAYDALNVVAGGVGVPNPTSGAIGLADEAAGHGLRYRDLGLTAPCSVMVPIDHRYWPAEGGPALFVDLTTDEGWFAPVMSRDLAPPDPPNPYFWLANGGKTNATITPHDLHPFDADEQAKWLDASRPTEPVWLEVRVDASWVATMFVNGVQIADLSATIPVALRGSTSHGFYCDVNATDGAGGSGGTRPQNLPVICGPLVARSLLPDATADGVPSAAEVTLGRASSLSVKGGRVDRLHLTPPPRLYSYGDVAQPALVVTATDGASDVLTVDDDAVTATVPTVATAVGVSGIAGATQGMRLVGKIATGTPTTGALGDVVLVADTGEWKLCTVAGTPGTWTTIGGGGSLDIAGLPPVASTDNGTDGRTRLDPTDSLPALVDGVQSEITLNELAALMAGMDNPKKITGSHTLDMATETTIVSDDASSYVLTLPHVDAADLPARPITTVQLGTGAITVTAGASAWILGSANRKTTRGQYTSQSYVPLFDLTGTTLWAPIDHGEVVGPSSSTSGNLASMSGTTGRLIADSGVAPDTSTALGTSDAKVPTQKAVKTYIDGRTPAASDTATGVVELATTAETQTGTDTARAVTPAGAASTYTPGISRAGRLWTRGLPATRPFKALVPSSSASVTSIGFGYAAATTGTVTTPLVTNKGYWTQAVTAASIGAGADVRFTVNAWYRGATSDLEAGAHFHARVRFPDASYDNTGASTGSYINVGLASVSPIAARRLASAHGVVFNREHENGHNTDSNWQVVVNDGGVTATTVDTGIPFTVGNEYEMWITMTAGATSIGWEIHDLTAGTSASNTVGTDLPGASTAIYPAVHLRTMDAVSRTMQVKRMYVEADKG